MSALPDKRRNVVRPHSFITFLTSIFGDAGDLALS